MSDCGCSNAGCGSALKPLEEALALLLSHARPVGETERLPLADALGRVLAEPVVSRVTMPPWDNSAMDGYAVSCADLQGESPTLRVSQRIPAGTFPAPLEPGTAARIFTGAPVPEGADTVVIQEVCEERDGLVTITRLPEAGANIRRAGEDTRAGETVLSPGTRLDPQHIGLAASVGIAEFTVHRRLKVALFSSGDELVEPGQPLAPGRIYDSNSYTLQGLLRSLGCEIVPLGRVEDSFEATCEVLERASRKADLIISSGGVSVGEEDHLKPAVEKLGSLDLWKIAIRPGKPLAFGHVNGTPFIGTPGNPVSLYVTFCLFARPFILRSQGVNETALQPTPVRALAGFDWPRPDKRREFARARLSLDDRGDAWVELHPSRSSGVLSSVTWAGGLAVLPEGRVMRRGDPVLFLSFGELLR